MNDHPLSEPTSVPDHARDLLCALAGGWMPAPMVFGQIEQLSYDGKDLSSYASSLSIHNDKLRVLIEAPLPNAELMKSARDGVLSGTLTGGACFKGRMASMLSSGFQIDQHGARASATIEAYLWNVLHGDAPSRWVGCIEGALDTSFGGNLIVERRPSNWPRAGAHCHYRLSGAYVYYLVQSGSGASKIWHLVVDLDAPGVPDLELLGRDFLVLEFVFGRQFRMPLLLGLDSDHHTVACMLACARRKHLEEHSFQPVPSDRNNDEWVRESWSSVFFERISAAWRKRTEADGSFWMALDMYLDAMKHYLDFDYMRLQIALEAFAYWCLRIENLDERIVVKSNRDAIRSLATEGFEEALFNKVIGVYRLSSGRVVPSAFSAYGVTLTDEMSGELEGRNTIVHQGLMAPEGYQVERDLRRVALVRTMLVALIAKAVGYGGAINGWEIGPLGTPSNQSTGGSSMTMTDSSR